MNTFTSKYREIANIRTERAIALCGVVLLVLGLARAESVTLAMSYLVVLVAAIAPAMAWARWGAAGIPVFPVYALAHIPYFALPVVSGNDALHFFSEGEIFTAAATVAAFLLVSGLVWCFLARRFRETRRATPPSSASNTTRLIFTGLALGIAFHLGTMYGALGVLGPFFGVARSIMVTVGVLACFLVGVTRAQGMLRGKAFIGAACGVGVLIALAWSSLFLVGGAVFILALLFGYVLVTRRIPWVSLLAAMLVIGVLHSGKGEMRARYWMEDSNFGAISPAQVPGFLMEWIAAGLSAIAEGEATAGALQRTSLLHMLLRTQSMAPDMVPYLEGETYALLAQVIVPRFINPDKPASQAAMDLLNIRYGLLTREDAAVTAIGWGVLAESYANYGYAGVFAIALLVGALCGLLSAWSIGRAVLSMPVLVSIASMMALINLEADFIQVCTVLLQLAIAVATFFAVYEWLQAHEAKGPTAQPLAPGAPPLPPVP